MNKKAENLPETNSHLEREIDSFDQLNINIFASLIVLAIIIAGIVCWVCE